MPNFIYLASQSPRRRELLDQLGVAHELLIAAADEDAEALEVLVPGESARHYVLRVTTLKAGAAIVRRRKRGLPVAPILAADTTVALGREILGKPDDERHAIAMLRRLSGTTHRVLTAVALVHTKQIELALSESRVTFKDLTQREIEAYVATGEPIGKAGAYAIQGRAAGFVSRLCGSHSGVVGLPLFETAELLRTLRGRAGAV